jgi:ABC-type transport system involved in multi-copper enzyme maturation permease subunit
MTWLTWRQFRPQIATALAALAAFAVLLAITGPHLASFYQTDGVTGCRGAGCAQSAGSFLGDAGRYQDVYVLGIAVIIFAPALIGLFWGAPLITREFETGTFRLAWTQTITRTRWLASKLALPGLAAIAVTTGLSLMFGWWAAPIGQAARLAPGSSFPLGMGPFSLLAFDAHGTVPLGYAAFAFTLGVTVGILLRRTIPAMAVTLAIFAAVQVAMPLGVRPHLFPAEHTTIAIASPDVDAHTSGTGSFSVSSVRDLPGQPGAWILSAHAVNAAGQPVSTSPACARQGRQTQNCLASQGIRVEVTYQPASRYWAIQWTETAIYLVMALALAGYCFRRLNLRRY